MFAVLDAADQKIVENHVIIVRRRSGDGGHRSSDFGHRTSDFVLVIVIVLALVS